MGGWLVLELGEFGVDGGAISEVVDDEGRRRIDVNARRGDV